MGIIHTVKTAVRFIRKRKGSMEEIHCEKCKKLIGYGDGDLNCCEFVCADCIDPAAIFDWSTVEL